MNIYVYRNNHPQIGIRIQPQADLVDLRLMSFETVGGTPPWKEVVERSRKPEPKGCRHRAYREVSTACLKRHQVGILFIRSSG